MIVRMQKRGFLNEMVAEKLGMTRVLLLEDDPNLAKSLVRFLEKEGFAVDWAQHGEEAVDLSFEKCYDLYLLDINVPLLNGIELLRSLREANDTTPAIIISAQVDVETMNEGFAAGADDYVKKPFNPKELLVRMKAKTIYKKQKKTVHGFSLNGSEDEVYYEDRLCKLSEISKNILIALLKAYPQPAEKERLMAFLSTQNDGALRVNIAKLKKDTELQIEAVRGVGYKIL